MRPDSVRNLARAEKLPTWLWETSKGYDIHNFHVQFLIRTSNHSPDIYSLRRYRWTPHFAPSSKY